MSAWNWVVAGVVALLLVLLLAFARGDGREGRTGSRAERPQHTVSLVA